MNKNYYTIKKGFKRFFIFYAAHQIRELENSFSDVTNRLKHKQFSCAFSTITFYDYGSLSVWGNL